MSFYGGGELIDNQLDIKTINSTYTCYFALIIHHHDTLC